MKTLIVNRINASLLSLVVLASLTLVGGTARAQDKEGAPSMELGPYIFNMGLTAGYRNTVVYGQGADEGSGTNLVTNFWAQERYYEALNYRTGLNVNSFNIYGEKKGTEGFFDEFYLNVDGLGDPYTTGSLRMRAFNQFDLKVDFRDMKYYVNRNDSLFTAMRKNDESRQFLNASLSYDASDNFNMKLAYYMTGHTGNYTSTFSPYVEDPNGALDGSFGGYARGNIYWLNAPKNDATSEYSLQATYKMDRTSATVGGGIRTYKQDYNTTPVSDTSATYFTGLGTPNWAGLVPFPNSPINSNNALSFYNWDDNQKSTTPFAYLEAVTRPLDGLSITANFRWENTKADGTLSGNLLGLMPRATTPKGGNPLRYMADTLSGTSSNTLGSIVGSLTVAGNLTDELTLTGLYRLTTTDLETNGTIISSVGATDSMGSSVYKSKISGATALSTVSNKVTQNFLEAFANWAPLHAVNIRAGIQYLTRTPVYNETPLNQTDSDNNAYLSRDTKTITPFVSFSVRPWKSVKFSGRYSHSEMTAYASTTTTVVDPMIRIDPEKNDKYSATLELTPTDDLRASLRYQGMHGTSSLVNMIPIVLLYNPMLNTGMTSLSASVGLNMTKKTVLNLSAEYRTNDFSIPVSWNRGTLEPVALRVFGDSLTTSAEQHTKDVYLDASITLNPIEPLHLLFGASLINSVGGTYMTPEVYSATSTPAPDLERQGGPYSYYVTHIQAGYDITRNVGVQFDYQFIAMKEQMVAAYDATWNNFNASLFRASVYMKL